MRHIATGLTALASLVVAAAGCATVATARFPNPSTFTDTPPARVEAVARQVLLGLRFRPILPEKSRGLIETEPVTGASWFEFWREDTIGPMQVAEASLHTVRRRVTLSVSPEGGGSKVFVRVVKERRFAPGGGPETVGETFNVYETSDTQLMKEDVLAEKDVEWIEMGRDPLLEQRILQRIHAAMR